MIHYSVLPEKVMDPVRLSLSLTDIALRSQRLMVDFLRVAQNWADWAIQPE